MLLCQVPIVAPRSVDLSTTGTGKLSSTRVAPSTRTSGSMPV
ncbi:hypothetical protein A2U01_0080141 [Trifolium medium]|uniref:Uncharacterized protein n=1 Tax=Trifolium medium TaxID=97028 RepID=A0A392TFH4_9FABA|nr:hypothetical protein [Trifolium medium]